MPPRTCLRTPLSGVRPISAPGRGPNHYESAHSTRSRRKEQALRSGELRKSPAHRAASDHAPGVPFLDRWVGEWKAVSG
ncbi:predicted protein [Streptomyces filamentosus NRRL 15998]|uniref:Predicted protein n=1 Tax=Streptomyces filamentosus NRRL 15998 TaxID=457431 RepID=D6ABN2_STRFL|nr:predicted protein [Streptomyces filamentosus NRRL 15998]